jgi:pimeloyl-ACP methyl ester carboxylesterase
VSPDPTPALRLAGRGLLAAGALAAGAAIGALAERSVMRSVGVGSPDGGELGQLRGDPYVVTTSDGTVLHVEVDEAPDVDSDLTLVFCHGYALSLDSWHFQREALRGKARLVFYDQRSHGRSTRAEFDTHHVDQLGSDLFDVISAVAPTGPLMLVGHSMGGMTVMALADQHPELFAERIYGVALIATTAGGLASGELGLPGGIGPIFHRVAPAVAAALATRGSLIDRLRWNDTDLGLMLTRMYSFGSSATDQAGRFVAGMVADTPIDVVAEFLPALQEHDKRDALTVLQHVELLVMVGDEDRLTPQNYSDEIVSLVPGAEYVVVRDAGHMVTLEKHEQVDEALLELLARVRRDLADEADGSVA